MFIPVSLNISIWEFIHHKEKTQDTHTHLRHAYLIILSPRLPFQHFGPAPLTRRPVWPLITLVPLPLSSPISRCLQSNPPTHQWTVNTQCLLCATTTPSLSGMCDMFFFLFFFLQIYWADEVQLDELLVFSVFPPHENLWMTWKAMTEQ